MHTVRSLLLVLLCYSLQGFSQTITHGPVVGGVTPESARMIIFTDTAVSVSVELAEDSSFSNSRSFTAFVRSTQGNSAMLEIDSLVPDTKYYYRGLINNNPSTDIRSFETYPITGESGNYTFLFGSCMNDNLNDDVIFSEAMKHPARFFLQIGDWGYPDVTDNLPNNNDFFPADYNRVISSYKDKYSYRHMKEYLKNIVVDYVWDDHDYVNNNASRNTSSYTDFGVVIQLLEVAFPAGTRRNTIDGYYNLFPGYEPVDSSEGVYHKFRFGNIEVFMLDDRAARTPTTDALQVNGLQVSFAPPSGHTIIGDKQRQWLLDGLRNSTATWKFITTATAFNRTYGNTLNAVLQLPAAIAQPLAAAIIDSWSGFPLDQDSLINTVKREKIDGVILMSGDTHTAAIDNGQSGGLPEIMAGGLSQVNSTLVNTVPLTALGLEWNEGGQGIGNVNSKDAFGKVSIFANDSVKLELIDEDGGLIADHTIYSCSYLSGLSLAVSSTAPAKCYDDSSGTIRLTAAGGSPPYRYTLDGKHYQNSGTFSGLVAGDYRPAVKDSNGCTKELPVTAIGQPEKLHVLTSKVDATCFGLPNGMAEAAASGGVPPYKYIWSNGDSSGNASDFPAGVHQVIVADSNNCIVSTSIQIEHPDRLEAQSAKSNITCFGKNDGSILVDVFGGTIPYRVDWSNGESNSEINALASGLYVFTVSDVNSCTSTDSVFISEPEPLSVDVMLTYELNGNSLAQLEVSGGIFPYSYQWSDQSTEDFRGGLKPGVYQVEITDAAGCRKSIDVTVPAETSIKDHSTQLLKIYPNPANGILVLEASISFSGEVVIQVMDISGRVIMSEETSFLKRKVILDINDLKSGTYFLVSTHKAKQEYSKFSVLK